MIRTTLAATALLASTAAFAQTATDSFDITVTLADACSVGAADLVFPTYFASDTAETLGATSIDVTCTLGTSYDLSFSAGLSGDLLARSMLGAGIGEILLYQLCDPADVLCLTPLGDGLGGLSSTLPGVGTGLIPVVHPVTGKIIAGQSVSPDTYTDTITVTATY